MLVESPLACSEALCCRATAKTMPRERAGNPGVWAIACTHRAAWLCFLFASVNMTSQLLPLSVTVITVNRLLLI